MTPKQQAVAKELKRMVDEHFPGSAGILLAIVMRAGGQGERGIEIVTNIQDPTMVAAVAARVAEHVKQHGKRTAS